MSAEAKKIVLNLSSIPINLHLKTLMGMQAFAVMEESATPLNPHLYLKEIAVIANTPAQPS